MEQPSADQVPDVRHHRDVGVDDRMVAPGDTNAHPADVQLLAVGHHLDLHPGLAEGLGAARVADDPDPGVTVQQPPQPLLVEVVGVLVGEEHRGQSLQLLEPGREVAGVQQQPGAALLDQQA
jgi:hypothetical protein